MTARNSCFGAASPPRERAARGRKAECIAERFLRASGLSVVARNFRRREGELDIVARDGDVIVFVEVRARRARARFDPAATIGAAKKRRLFRAANRWLGEQGLGGARCRYDIVAVSVDASGWRVRHIRDAFVDDEP